MCSADGGVSHVGRHPTRKGGFLACGLPAAARKGMGNVAQFMQGHRRGVSPEGRSASVSHSQPSRRTSALESVR